MSDFERFTWKHNLGGPRVTISAGKSSNLYFNKASYEMMGCPTHLLLHYDAANQRVGFKPVERGDDDAQFAYTVVKNKTRNHFILCVRAFFSRYNLSPHRQLALYPEGDLFVADLPKVEEE